MCLAERMACFIAQNYTAAVDRRDDRSTRGPAPQLRDGPVPADLRHHADEVRHSAPAVTRATAARDHQGVGREHRVGSGFGSLSRFNEAFRQSFRLHSARIPQIAEGGPLNGRSRGRAASLTAHGASRIPGTQVPGHHGTQVPGTPYIIHRNWRRELRMVSPELSELSVPVLSPELSATDPFSSHPFLGMRTNIPLALLSLTMSIVLAVLSCVIAGMPLAARKKSAHRGIELN